MLIEAQFEHLGLAVRRIADAVKFLKCLGYVIGDEIYDPLQNVILVLCTHPTHPAVEVIAPSDSSGPLDGILRLKDALAYHCCYRVESSVSTLERLEEAGVRVIEVSPPQRATLFPGYKVSFYNGIGFGLFELLEKDTS